MGKIMIRLIRGFFYRLWNCRLGKKVNNLLQSLKNLSPGRLASIAAIIIFLISFFVYIGVQMSSTEYSVLYTDLELEDAKQIVSRLETANVKYRLAKNGTERQILWSKLINPRKDREAKFTVSAREWSPPAAERFSKDVVPEAENNSPRKIDEKRVPA